MPRKASPKSTLPSSEDNASQAIINVEDDNLANTAAQLSISEDAASELESLPSQPSLLSQPSQTSHACVFDIQFNTLEYRGQLLKDVQYRPRNKRVLNTKTKVSWGYEHGADLQADSYEKLWLDNFFYLAKLRLERFFWPHTTQLKSGYWILFDHGR
jgi:hypothetical protein